MWQQIENYFLDIEWRNPVIVAALIGALPIGLICQFIIQHSKNRSASNLQHKQQQFEIGKIKLSYQREDSLELFNHLQKTLESIFIFCNTPNEENRLLAISNNTALCTSSCGLLHDHARELNNMLAKPNPKIKSIRKKADNLMDEYKWCMERNIYTTKNRKYIMRSRIYRTKRFLIKWWNKIRRKYSNRNKNVKKAGVKK